MEDGLDGEHREDNLLVARDCEAGTWGLDCGSIRDGRSCHTSPPLKDESIGRVYYKLRITLTLSQRAHLHVFDVGTPPS